MGKSGHVYSKCTGGFVQLAGVNSAIGSSTRITKYIITFSVGTPTSYPLFGHVSQRYIGMDTEYSTHTRTASRQLFNLNLVSSDRIHLYRLVLQIHIQRGSNTIGMAPSHHRWPIYTPLYLHGLPNTGLWLDFP